MNMRCFKGMVFLAAAVMLAACVSGAFAQGRQRGGQGGRGGPGGFGGRTGGSIFGGVTTLLRRDDVRKELDLLDDQIKDLENVQQEQMQGMRDLFGQMREMSSEQRTAKMREVGESLQKKVNQILLPHQIDRLKQIQLQMQLRGSAMGALGSETLQKELNITSDQKERIQARAQQVNDELRKKIEALRKEAQQKLLSELSPQQRSKFEQMIGAPFEFTDNPQQRGGRPGGGGFGGPGGAGGRPRGSGRPGG